MYLARAIDTFGRMALHESVRPKRSRRISGAPVVEIWRGPYLESVHELVIAVVNGSGDVLYSAGNIDFPFPVRSLAKPFIAAELIRSGAAEALRLEPSHIALASGSHDGEYRHVSCVKSFLKLLDLDESALLCGDAFEGNVKTGPPEANNCSGKHAAVLALCRHWGFTTKGYIDASHEVQRRLQPLIMAKFGLDPNAELAVDGCGMPIFGASLRSIAGAYAKLAASNDPAEWRVRASIGAHPHLFGGAHSNFDTLLAGDANGAVVGKIGAEGLHADGITDADIGIAVKVLDGNSRGIPLVISTLLRRFSGKSVYRTRIARIPAARTIFNAAGRQVGSIRVTGF